MESSDTNACPSASHTSTRRQASKSSKKAQLRGPTGKFLVELWSTGEIVGANASQFKTAIGEAVRHHIPLNTKDYRKLNGNFKEDIWTDLTKKYEFNVGDYAARPFIEKHYSQKLRSWKADLRDNFLGKAESIEEARANCPPDVNPAHWVEFVDYEFQPEVKSRNKKNGENRALNTIGSTHGRNSIPQIHDKLQKQNPHVKITRVDDWLYGCERCDGSILPSAKEKYEQVKEVKRRKIANEEGNNDEEDISCDALVEVFGKEKKNRVRGVGSNITRKQLEHATVANVLLNQMTTSSIAAVHADVAKFTSKFDTDLSDVKSLLMVLIQQKQGNTVTLNGESSKGVSATRTDVCSNSSQRRSPVTPSNLTPAFGSLDQHRVTLLDKYAKEVAKGFVDNTTGTVCHGRDIYAGEKKVYIDEVLVPDAAVYDGPQDGNSTLNAWLEGGFIVWLDGRLKYE